MTLYDLIGRKAMVTGGAQGLGAGMAQALAAAGASVMIGDLQQEAGKATAAAITESGATAGFVHLDVTDDASWESAVQATIAQLGGLDIVVNNAGILRDRMLTSMGEEEFDSVIAVHLKGTFNVARHAATYWRAQAKAGSERPRAIVNTSSLAPNDVPCATTVMRGKRSSG